jgi:hypothetical protein
VLLISSSYEPKMTGASRACYTQQQTTRVMTDLLHPMHSSVVPPHCIAGSSVPQPPPGDTEPLPAAGTPEVQGAMCSSTEE